MMNDKQIAQELVKLAKALSGGMIDSVLKDIQNKIRDVWVPLDKANSIIDKAQSQMGHALRTAERDLSKQDLKAYVEAHRALEGALAKIQEVAKEIVAARDHVKKIKGE